MNWLTRKADRIITMYFGALEPTGLIIARVGLGFLLAVALMSFGFGKEMHWVHGLALLFLTFVTAIVPDAGHHLFERKKFFALGLVALFGAPMFWMEFTTHAGYAAGFRGKDVSEARVQNTKWDGAQEAAKEDKANLEMWKAQLAKLMDQDAWTATVKADALREQLATVKERMVAEEKGARGRKAGRGKEFEGLQNEANALSIKIAKVEQREDLNKRIEATQRILDGKRAAAAVTEHKASAIGFQNEFFSQVAAFASGSGLNVSEVHKAGAEYGLSVGLAYAFTFGPAMAFFLAGMYRRKGEEVVERVPSAQVVAPYSEPTPQSAPLVSRESSNYVLVNDDEARKLKEAIKNAIAPRRLRAA